MKTKLLLTFSTAIFAFSLTFGQGQATGYVLGVGTGADIRQDILSLQTRDLRNHLISDIVVYPAIQQGGIHQQ